MSNKKLRDAIHDIVTNLDKDQSIDIEELSSELLLKYKITISPKFLDEYLNDFNKIKRGYNVSDTIFSRQDARWLNIKDKDDTKELRNNLYYQRPSLAKHKDRMVKDIIEKRLDDAYKSGMKDLKLSEETIKKTFILQDPNDAKNIIKSIYEMVNIQMKYKNTKENCWKMMIIMGYNRMKLDTKKNYFDLAPESIKKEYEEIGKINLTLEKEDVRKPDPILMEDDTKKSTKNDMTLKEWREKNNPVPSPKKPALLTKTADIKDLDEIVAKNLDTNKIFRAEVYDDPKDISSMNLSIDTEYANLFTFMVPCVKIFYNTNITIYWDEIGEMWCYSEKLKKYDYIYDEDNEGNEKKPKMSNKIETGTNIKPGDVLICQKHDFYISEPIRKTLELKLDQGRIAPVVGEKNFDYYVYGTANKNFVYKAYHSTKDDKWHIASSLF